MLKQHLIDILAMCDASPGFKTPMLLYRFLIRNGRELKGSKRPRYVHARKLGECFKNAAHCFWENEDFQYYEGLALNDGIPIPLAHAWNVRGDSEVVDLTWRKPEKATYLGVMVPKGLLNKTLMKQKTYGVFDNGCGFNIDVMLAMDPGFKEVLESCGLTEEQINRLAS